MEKVTRLEDYERRKQGVSTVETPPDGEQVFRHPEPIAKLTMAFDNMPGIGYRMAQRMAFHILRMSKKDAVSLANSIIEVRKRIGHCLVCNNLTEEDPCWICKDNKRDRSVICVVEEPDDLDAIEETREYRGLYHVLLGVISPLDGIGPEDIKIKELMERLKGGTVKEVIVATNPNVEGEATAFYLAKIINSLNVKVTRIALGMPVGGDLLYTDVVTLIKALDGRMEIGGVGK
jgi:recombination protein RecR